MSLEKSISREVSLANFRKYYSDSLASNASNILVSGVLLTAAIYLDKSIDLQLPENVKNLFVYGNFAGIFSFLGYNSYQIYRKTRLLMITK